MDGNAQFSHPSVMTVHRNAPCPCGSGRKYKNCHGKASRVERPSGEAAWRRIRTATDGFPSTMFRFIREVFGRDAVHEAWAEFTLWDDQEPEFDPESHHLEVFLPWFFHRWMPDPLDTDVADAALHGRTPTSVFLERRGRRLEPILRRYLEACLVSPFSFHEVVAVEPGSGFRARDVFSGEEHDVLERSASRTLGPGDILFGQLVTAEGVTLLEACSPLAIPPREKISLIELRERLVGEGPPLTSEDLVNWDLELREEYLAIAEELMNPRTPTLQNTDGEPVVFHRLSFRVPSAQGAFDALKHLALGREEGELLESAEYDAQGRLARVSLPWLVAGNAVHSTWENTVLGHIEIDGERLVANVNSAGRASRLSALVAAACPDARHEGTEVESLEEAMARSEVEGEDPGEGIEGRGMPPEARALAQEIMASQYEHWIHEKVPVLGGISPAEAMNEPVGREKVEALIAQIERDGKRMDPPLDESIVRRMREQLGLGS
jgi:hypothetical protein